jgi:hypothetical protein
MDRTALFSGQAAGLIGDRPDVLVDPEWDAVFETAAGQAGAAAAAAVGGPEVATIGDEIGRALWRSIAGEVANPEDEFKRHVLARLENIEQKLDKILDFFARDLTGVVRVATQQALAQDINNQLNAARREADGVFATVSKAELTDAEFAFALQTASDVFKLGIRLMLYGQEFYPAVVHSYVSGLALYGKLSKLRPKWTGALVTFAGAYHEFAEHCLAESVPLGYWPNPIPAETMKMASDRIAREDAWTPLVLRDVRSRRVTWLLATNGASIAHGGWFETVNGPNFNGNYTFYFSGIDGQALPTSREELIRRLTSAPLNWEIPQFREVFEVADSPKRDGYAETVTQLWSAQSMEQRNAAGRPMVTQAIQALTHLRDSTASVVSLKRLVRRKP